MNYREKALRAALQGMVDNFRPFTAKPMGAPGSAARAEQDYQAAAHAFARHVLDNVCGSDE